LRPSLRSSLPPSYSHPFVTSSSSPLRIIVSLAINRPSSYTLSLPPSLPSSLSSSCVFHPSLSRPLNPNP
jgi:hypothetical protein